MKKILLTSLLFSFLINTQAQDSLNIRKLSTWTSSSATAYSDIWGYEANGREYAIIGSNWGTHFVDVTNPSNPIEISSFIGVASNVIWRDFKVYGTYAYGVSDGPGNSSLQIFDLSNLPASVSKIYDNDSLTQRAHNIFIEGNRIYLPSNRRNGTNYPLDVLSIANPTNPTLIGTMDNSFFGGCWGCLHDIYVKNDTAYCSAGNTGMFIYDLTNINSPSLISSITVYSEQGYNHASWVNEDYNTMIMADETHGSGLKSFDMTDITNPVEIDVFRTVAGSIPHNPFIKGTEAIISHYHDGVQIFDISDPSNVTQKAFYDTYPDNAPTDHSGYEGDWGVYPYFSSGNIIASDITYGLFVLGKVNDVSISGGDITACINDTLSIPYDIKGAFNNGNNFYLEFSDTNGYFKTTQLIDTINSTSAGTFTTTLPSSLQIGTDYKVRVLSSSPTIIDGGYIHLTILENKTSTSNISICMGDSIVIGTKIYFSEGSYFDTLQGNNCDSIITTVLNIDSIDTPIIINNATTLSSTLANNYQWYLNGNSLSGENSQTLSYSQYGPGNYYVEVTENNCNAISNTFKYLLTSLLELDNSRFSIFPNPSNGLINIRNGDNIHSTINIINSLGQVIKSYQTTKSISVELDKGIYIVKIINNKENISQKIIIE